MYQENYDAAADGSGFGFMFLLVCFALYFYLAFSQFKMAQKCGHSDSAWWSFIPILNTILIWKMSGKEWYWFVFFLVPIVNVIAFFIVWAEVAKNLGHSAFWGAMVMIPGINFVALYILAFTEGENRRFQTPPPSQSFNKPQTPTHV